MTENYDLFFDLHLDSLKFLNYDIPFEKYFYTFPKPEITQPNFIGPYIISHLISSTSQEHRLNDWYVTRLVKDLDAYCKSIGSRNFLISTPEFNKFYDEVMKDCSNTHILNSDITGVCDMILNAQLMVSVDSGFRPVAYPLMPVVSLSKQCFAPNQMNISHVLRWNPIKPYFPLNHNTSDIIKTIDKLLTSPDKKFYQLFPEYCLTDTKLDDILIRRHYKISDKSILN